MPGAPVGDQVRVRVPGAPVGERRQPSSPVGLVASVRPAPIATTAAKRPPAALSALLLTTTPPYTWPVFAFTGSAKPPFCTVYLVRG